MQGSAKASRLGRSINLASRLGRVRENHGESRCENPGNTDRTDGNTKNWAYIVLLRLRDSEGDFTREAPAMDPCMVPVQWILATKTKSFLILETLEPRDFPLPIAARSWMIEVGKLLPPLRCARRV